MEGSPSNEIYGTIRLPQFMKNQQNENKNKLQFVKKQLQEIAKKKSLKEQDEFMGMTDDEIMVNKT